jgi:hypothetical protein
MKRETSFSYLRFSTIKDPCFQQYSVTPFLFRTAVSLREFWTIFEGKNAVLSRLMPVFGGSGPEKVPKMAAN